MRPRLQGLLSGGVTAWLVVGGGTIYVVLAGWLMAATPYDTWGVLVALPFAAVISVVIARFIFRDELSGLRRIAMIGLAAKLAGTIARYWMASSYGTWSDSYDYHTTGRIIAGELWHGKISIVELVPHTQGTRFMGELTGVLYAVAGSSRLAGFLWYGLAGYVGVALTVKAACLAVPDLLRNRYAWLCFLMPSLVFWPSSIGKEAWMSLVLGMASLGVARLLRRDGTSRGLPLLVVGLVGAMMVRPHMAAIWLAAFVVAVAWSTLTRRDKVGTLDRGRLALFAAVGVAGLWLLAKGTLTYLNPAKEVDASVSDILGLASARTSQGGSRFTPPTIGGPLDYPFAVMRTLTRPFLWEVNTLPTLLPALEMTFLLGLVLAARRRVANVFGAMKERPFVLFAVLVCFMGALAFATFGNLAILVRQRSLLLPMLLLLPCLPQRIPRAARRAAAGHTATEGARAVTLSPS